LLPKNTYDDILLDAVKKNCRVSGGLDRPYNMVTVYSEIPEVNLCSVSILIIANFTEDLRLSVEFRLGHCLVRGLASKIFGQIPGHDGLTSFGEFFAIVEEIYVYMAEH
jgi:hypothetical protein